MKVAHGNAPICHEALWILLQYPGVNLFRFRIFERMQQRSGKVEVGLHCFGAGSSETDLAKLAFTGSAQSNVATRKVQQADLTLQLIGVGAFVAPKYDQCKQHRGFDRLYWLHKSGV